MTDVVTLISPQDLRRNPDNPRLIFRKEDLDSLQKSIADQGILVPLTVFEEGKEYRLLDGERRWRCAVKLGLSRVPVIIQPKPERLQNIMMMFAIHNARKDWDPLPTALKLRDLEKEFSKRYDRKPSEVELAGLASITRGEVRRLKKLLGLPKNYIDELLDELKKPHADQVLRVDHVLEATAAASLLRKRGVVTGAKEDRLRRAIIQKFRIGVISNTVAPRKLSRIARAVHRKELSLASAKRVIQKLIEQPQYDIDSAFRDSVEQVDFEHGIEQLVDRLIAALRKHRERGYAVPRRLRKTLRELTRILRTIIKRN